MRNIFWMEIIYLNICALIEHSAFPSEKHLYGKPRTVLRLAYIDLCNAEFERTSRIKESLSHVQGKETETEKCSSKRERLFGRII